MPCDTMLNDGLLDHLAVPKELAFIAYSKTNNPGFLTHHSLVLFRFVHFNGPEKSEHNILAD